MSSAHDTLLIQLQTPDASWVDVAVMHRVKEAHWLEFVDTYWDLPSRPILGQIYEEQGRRWTRRTRVNLPRWFSHLLPEGRLRHAVAQAAGISEAREFELLRRLGDTDLPGALRALEINAGMPLLPDADDEDHAESSEPVLKFSLAGAQLKFSVVEDQRGITVPARGQAGMIIAKFPDERPGFEFVPEVEHAAMSLARACGVSTAMTRLIDPTEIAGLEGWSAGAKGLALAVDRFDRLQAGGRVHMEEFAQILQLPTRPPEKKYATNFETIAVLTSAIVGVEAVAEVIDRIVFSVLIGNGDAHAKNWALLYPDGRNAELSPAYDLLPTVLYIAGDDLGLKISGSRRFIDVTPNSFDDIGERADFGVRNARQRSVEMSDRIRDKWRELRDYLTPEQYERLTARLDRLPMRGPRSL